jgi:hypothetical protein
MIEGAFKTEDLTFYHGTGAEAARAILSGSRSSLFIENGAFTLGSQIRSALLEHARLSPNEDWILHTRFDCPGSEYSSLWVSALRQCDDSQDRSVFAYGYFFVTLNIANAYRYTISNPYRSEFICALAESLKVLQHIGHPLAGSVPASFPEIDRAIKNPSSPVVLELRGVSRDRLLTERGDHDIDGQVELFFKMQKFRGANDPAAFRVRDVTASDIVAVHALSDWPSDEADDVFWRPEPSKVSAARRSPQDWLADDRSLPSKQSRGDA